MEIKGFAIWPLMYRKKSEKVIEKNSKFFNNFVLIPLEVKLPSCILSYQFLVCFWKDIHYFAMRFVFLK